MPLNEYHIVRTGKPVAGVKGEDMNPDDKRRMRYYVQAGSSVEAVKKMAERFPGEKFVVVKVCDNVKPFFNPVKEKVAA